MRKLSSYGIQTRSFFWPMNEQKIFKKLKIFDNSKYPNSKYLSRCGFTDRSDRSRSFRWCGKL